MLLVQVITGGGSATATERVAELLAIDGSNEHDSTVAVLASEPITAQLVVATSVIVAELPAAISSIETVPLLPDPLHTPPPVDEQETKPITDGRSSVTTIFVAASGPLFVTVIV
jgi:hypothetical protein